MSEKLTDNTNWVWMRERLEDLTLMERAVAVPVETGEFVDIAVPVGGKRRAGNCSADPVASAPVITEMLHRPGDFPRLRWNWEDNRLEWGEDLDSGAAAAGDPGSPASERFYGEGYGYSEEAIRAFLKERAEDADGWGAVDADDFDACGACATCAHAQVQEKEEL